MPTPPGRGAAARPPSPAPPRPIHDPHVWRVQPVVAVRHHTDGWSGALPMLDGVPTTGWSPSRSPEPHAGTALAQAPAPDDARVAHVVDRLLLEAQLMEAHGILAHGLHIHREGPDDVYLTWVPDLWSLAALHDAWSAREKASPPPKHLVYPGYGLRPHERADLARAATRFGADVTLRTYEEVWPDPPAPAPEEAR